MKIGYNISAGSATRVWPDDNSVALLQRILDGGRNRRVVLFAVPAERQRARDLQRYFPERVHLVPDRLTLMQAAAVISKLDVLITPDTSLVHIARSFRVPVVGLYSRYQKNFLLWRPYGQESGAVVSGHDDNIFDITVDAVHDTFEAVHTDLISARSQ